MSALDTRIKGSKFARDVISGAFFVSRKVSGEDISKKMVLGTSEKNYSSKNKRNSVGQTFARSKWPATAFLVSILYLISYESASNQGR